MKKHFVEFLSPGTFLDETSLKEIDSWNIDKAVEMARSISERYNATPYGFRFITRERNENDLDSKAVDHSNIYYLGGKIETLEEIQERNDPNEKILRSNMEGNGWKRIITNNNSWKVTKPLLDSDVVLDFTP